MWAELYFTYVEEIYQISSIFGHVLKKAMVLAITEKNNVKINLRSLLNGKYTY